MELISKTLNVNKTAEYLCDYLSKVANYEALLPENTTKFEIKTDQSFVFALKGMPEIALDIKTVNSPDNVILGATNPNLPFTLTAKFTEPTAQSCHATLVFEGKFNAMMTMMIKNPIKNFINTLIENIAKL